jgi:hypothetical protein
MAEDGVTARVLTDTFPAINTGATDVEDPSTRVLALLCCIMLFEAVEASMVMAA